MKRLLIIFATVAILGVGCGKKTEAPTTTSEDQAAGISETEMVSEDGENDSAATEPETMRNPDYPITYDLGEIGAVTERGLLLVRELFTSETLANTSAQCGTNLTSEHFTERLEQFKYQRGHRYSFLHRDTSREPTIYTVTVIANGPGYESLEEFKNDFDVCIADGNLYPLDLNNNWLVFESGCGASEDSGCNDIRTQIVNTLTIN